MYVAQGGYTPIMIDKCEYVLIHYKVQLTINQGPFFHVTMVSWVPHIYICTGKVKVTTI